MIFDNNIKPSQLLVPILFGLLSFAISIIYLNYSFKWPSKSIQFSQNSKTFYKPVFETFDSLGKKSNVADTLFTPFVYYNKKGILSSEKFIYNRFPLLLIWIMSIGVLVGFGFSFIPLYIRKIQEYGFKWRYFLVAFLTIFTLFLPQLIIERFGPLNLLMPKDIQNSFGVGFTENALIFNSMIPFVPILFWIVAIISILTASYNDKHDVQKIQILKSEFETFYIVVAISMGLSIFCNNIYNMSINQVLQTTESFKVLPNEFAFINAIIYSFVLVLSYIFISGYLNSLLINNATNQINNNLNNKTFYDYFTVILSMLAPLLGGWVADLVKLVNM